MDGNEYNGFYLSRDQGHQTYAYGSNWEESQHQGYNQYQSDDEQCYESDGGHDGEGYEYENEIRAYGQQTSYGGIYDQGEGYHNPQWEGQYCSTHLEDPMWEGDQSFHEEQLYDHYPSSPKQASFQDDALMDLMTQLLDQQKEMSERLDRLEDAYMVEVEGSSNEEGLKSFEDQGMESSLEVLDQALEEEGDEEGLSAVDYILSFFSTSPTNDELISHLGESLEDQHEMQRGLVIHDDLISDACEDLSRGPPSQQEFISMDEGVESWTPKCQNEDVNDWLSAKSWSRVEDPYLFTLPPEKLLSFRPYMDIPIERNSYDPSIPNESNLPKGSKSAFDIHLKLGGCKWKWDIKIS